MRFTGLVVVAAAVMATMPMPDLAATSQSAQPSTPQECLKAGRDFSQKRMNELAPLTLEIFQKITAERVAMVRACAAGFDVDKAAPSELPALVDLFADAQQFDVAERGIARGLASDAPPAPRADLLVAAVRMLLRQPKSAARNAKAESYIDALDALPDAVIDQKVAAHGALNGYYRGDDIDAGIITHSTWLIDKGRSLSPELRKKYGATLTAAYVNLAEAYAGQGENDRAVDLLKRAPAALADVPNVELRTKGPLARYLLVGTAANPIGAPWWLNREAAAGPLDLKGAVTLVQFTAHWCGPCKESYPGMLRLQERFKGREFREVFVTRPYGFFENERNITAEQEIERDRQYFARYGFAIPIAIGPPVSVIVGGKPTQQDEPNEQAFMVSGIPQINVVDRKGRIRLIMIGYDDANEAKLGAFIDKLLAEK